MQRSGDENGVKGTEEGGFHCGDGVALVMRGGRWARQVVDLINLHIERHGDIVPQGLEPGMAS